MWLDPWFSSPALQDLIATILTFGVALGWLRLMDSLAHRGVLDARLSRKIIHIGTGPLFVLCWNLFSAAPSARLWAALVPLAITLQFVAVGLGWMKDEPAVQAMTRHGDPHEILRGPVFYGLVFVGCTIVFWRSSPVGVIALMVMCGGDGLADIVGRRWGSSRLPFNPEKSWLGSAAMMFGGLALAASMVWLFDAWDLFEPSLQWPPAAWKIGVVALVATLVESLPLRDVDNLTTTGAAILVARYLF